MIIFDVEVQPLTQAEEDIAFAGMNTHSAAQGAPAYERKSFGLHAREDDKTIGLLGGNMVWGWLYIETLWVEDGYRHKGLGSELMQRAETMARQKNLIGIHLSTQSWQAPEFYQKLGYQIFAEYENFPPGYKRFLLRKYL